MSQVRNGSGNFPNFETNFMKFWLRYLKLMTIDILFPILISIHLFRYDSISCNDLCKVLEDLGPGGSSLLKGKYKINPL